METKSLSSKLDQLSDEQVLKEFVKRFKCDGAILIYLENNCESGLARWTNKNGKNWVNNLMPLIKEIHT
ncbi:hypothetical protein [Chryseobacterium sp. 1B4]|uniref:hypothetical protein n=1 Tax=Chryseobacterium sp. S90 TaxID=3395373 RepID=UPI002FC7DDB5